MAILTIDPPLFTAAFAPINVTHIPEEDLTEKVIDELLETSTTGVLGTAASFGIKGVLTKIAFASSSRVLLVQLTRHGGKFKAGSKQGSKDKAKGPTKTRELLRDKLLCHPDYVKLGFDMERYTTALYLDYSLTITRAIDLQSVVPAQPARRTLEIFIKVLGGGPTLNRDAVRDTFMDKAFDSGSIENVSLRAWASFRVWEMPQHAKVLLSVPRIDTSTMNTKHLTRLAEFVRIEDRLHALKPTRVKHDVAREWSMDKSGKLKLGSSNFRTRLRVSGCIQRVEVKVASQHGRSSSSGRTVGVKGRDATISLNQDFPSTAKLRTVHTIGRDPPTPAEDMLMHAILSVLQSKSNLLNDVFARRIFFSDVVPISSSREAAGTARPKKRPSVFFPFRQLNDSQTEAVERILSGDEDDRACLVLGSPGAGKTSVITAAVTSIMNNDLDKRCVWLLARSNVAVKNIAEKLADIGFLDFKILVSYDFHFDWHEHLYKQIECNIIRSDGFKQDQVATERLLMGSRVILATLSMMSHPRLVSCHFPKVAPPHTIIIDEASQIGVGDYIPLLHLHGKYIRKLAFIGDDKQLAPYGAEEVDDLYSVFEIEELRKNAVFLDTQYRMPGPIGEFISRHVYGGRLKTSHAVKTRRCCRFVDVHHGKEQKAGNSWKNVEEVEAIVHIVRRFHAQRKSFRVITPYNPQRKLLEDRLKAESLPWENKCFCIDSFQGNEEDHIIISVVRSDKVGFLSNLRRTNVMLSRCKQSMTICTSRAFLQGVAVSTLVGELAAEWEDDSAWLSWRDILNERF